MYSKIVNPNTGRKVLVNSRLGKKIVRQYLEILTGGAGAYAMKQLYAPKPGEPGVSGVTARDEVFNAGVVGPARHIMDFVGPPEVLVGMLEDGVTADARIPSREAVYSDPLRGVVSDRFELERDPEIRYTIIKLTDPAHIMPHRLPDHDAFLLLNIRHEEDAEEDAEVDTIYEISNQLLHAKIIFINRDNASIPIIIKHVSEENDDMEETVSEHVEWEAERLEDSGRSDALEGRPFHYIIDLGNHPPSRGDIFTIELQAPPRTGPIQSPLVVKLVIQNRQAYVSQ